MSARDDPVERDVARTADLILKLSALVERYEAGSGSTERVSAMREAMCRGRRQIAVLAGIEGDWTHVPGQPGRGAPVLPVPRGGHGVQ